MTTASPTSNHDVRVIKYVVVAVLLDEFSFPFRVFCSTLMSCHMQGPHIVWLARASHTGDVEVTNSLVRRCFSCFSFFMPLLMLCFPATSNNNATHDHQPCRDDNNKFRRRPRSPTADNLDYPGCRDDAQPASMTSACKYDNNRWRSLVVVADESFILPFLLSHPDFVS